MKKCYVKCTSNEQAQKLRPYLVEVGFVDDKKWNDKKRELNRDSLHFRLNVFSIYREEVANSDGEPLLHTVPADADLAETAKIIKELFDKL